MTTLWSKTNAGHWVAVAVGTAIAVGVVYLVTGSTRPSVLAFVVLVPALVVAMGVLLLADELVRRVRRSPRQTR